jgi:uncharacterized membrane-anchored protein YitT (DUF2179 family)
VKNKMKKIWPRLRDIAFISIGALIQAVAMNMFFLPAKLSSGGVSGMAQIVHALAGWPVGVMIIVANIPLFWLGWRFLGGRRFLGNTVLAVVLYAALVDLLAPLLPSPITQDTILIAIFGGVINGLGLGLVFRGQGTSGGTDILARLLGQFRGIPLGQSYLITDALVILASGFTFGWTLALYAIVALYVAGATAELISEGSSVVRTATIITNRPEDVAKIIMLDLNRGVTYWAGKGMYSGGERAVLFCAISRSEVNQLKHIVHDADPAAFMVIGQAHEALGEGFKPFILP